MRVIRKVIDFFVEWGDVVYQARAKNGINRMY